ncbi:hypothetical protein [Bdellovibrio sp.]|uniref:hypothetical protein n=1 Tax=Bdellovibrio sp. TaxID=28201 RepID=UPI003221E701
MAVQTVGIFVVISIGSIHGLHHGLMTGEAGIFHHLQAVLLDQDRLMEVLQCECGRVSPAIQGFNGVLSDNVVRQMTVIAFSNVMVSRFLLGIQIVLHDVTIDAGLWVI